MNFLTKLSKKINYDFHLRDKVGSFVIINLLLVIFQILYIKLRFYYINSQIPFWFTKPWGDLQLAPKVYLYFLPAGSFLLLVTGLIIVLLSSRYFLRYIGKIIYLFVTAGNLLLTYSIYKIILSASNPFPYIINPLYLVLAAPFLVAFFASYLLLPVFINVANEKNLVTNPGVHSHPGMVLTKPSARGGGFIYAIVFLTLAVLLTGFIKEFTGLYISIFMLGMLGLIDDIQNTHVSSSFRIIENPVLRLILLVVGVLPVIISGIKIEAVSNPVGNILTLSSINFNFAGNQISFVSAILTVLWIVWVMNLMSWSNGIDGQFGGIVGIASIIVALLALRFSQLDALQKNTAILAAISSGIAFGFTKYTWYPSKIMWGFGAVTAGLILAVLSIMIQGKIVTSILILLIPFLDAVVTIVRRLLQGKNPLKGDKGHLHHLLLKQGWSARKIALFYWAATAFFGFIGIVTADKYTIQTALILTGVVAFVIILVNLRSIKLLAE